MSDKTPPLNTPRWIVWVYAGAFLWVTAQLAVALAGGGL
jgi:hypothetical protein